MAEIQNGIDACWSGDLPDRRQTDALIPWGSHTTSQGETYNLK